MNEEDKRSLSIVGILASASLFFYVLSLSFLNSISLSVFSGLVFLSGLFYGAIISASFLFFCSYLMDFIKFNEFIGRKKQGRN